jgi:hypothetical protein
VYNIYVRVKAKVSIISNIIYKRIRVPNVPYWVKRKYVCTMCDIGEQVDIFIEGKKNFNLSYSLLKCQQCIASNC